jgi:hypothetical protein
MSAEFLAYTTSAGVDIVVRKPTGLEVKRVLKADGQAARVDELDRLGRSVVVRPAPDILAAIYDDAPMLPITVGGFALQLASDDAEALAKKV